MPRLEGEKKSPLPIILGVVGLLALGALAYYLLSNRTSETPDSGTETTTTRPPATNSGEGSGSSNATPSADETPSADATPGMDATPSADATPTMDATPSANATPDSMATPGAMSGNDASGSGAMSSGNSSSSGAMSSNRSSGSSMSSSNMTSGGAMSGNAATGPAFKRSKTIVNHKTGTSVTYSKEIAPNGATLSRSKSATPVAP